MTLELRQRLLGTTLLVSASLFAAPAFAQDATPEEPLDADTTTSPVQGTVAPTTNVDSTPADSPADIVITGSRIPQPNLTSSSPVTVVSSQEVKLSGVTRVEDLLNSLPQVFAGQTSTDANGATGIATVNLRGLGSQRTLVLINGRRLMPGDVGTPVADINFIPGSVVKRVDVLTGGASSVYGSDALAGVVNFIMDTSFTGIRVDAQGSFFQHNNGAKSLVLDAMNSFGTNGIDYPTGNVIDGGQQEITVSIGADLGGERRGHVLAYAGYRNVTGILQADRDFSSCGLSGNFDTTNGYLICAGSSTAPTGRFRRTRVTGSSGGQPVFGATGPSFTVDPATGELINAAGPSGSFDNQYRFNFNPYNHFQRPDERYVLGAFANYEISSGFQPYMEAMFMNDRSIAAIAPSGAFYGTDFNINCASPLLTANDAATLCGVNAGVNTLQSVYIGRRNVEGGPRVSDLRHTDYRIVAGMKGDITRGLSYDVYGQYGAVNQSAYSIGDFSRSRLNRSLDVIDNPNTPGVVDPVCRSAIPNADGAVIDPLCVPYDIFTPGGVTQGAVNYLSVPNIVEGDLRQNILSGVVTLNGAEYGFQTPWAQEGIGIAIGAEYRKDSLQIRNDVQNLTGDIAGSGAPNGVKDADGFTTVKEIFGEANIPIASGIPGIHELTLSLSGRHSKYNTSGSTDAYKVGLEYAPTPDIRARASYNRAVRAPNVLELFTPATVVLFGIGTLDPCGGGADPGDTTTGNGGVIANCLQQFNGSGVDQATALAAIQAGIDSSPANQYYQRVAGNLDLSPETSDSYTLGLVLTPRFLPGFNATIDAFDIRVQDTISSLGASFVLSQCSANGTFCDGISRSADGSLFTGPSFVDNPNFNLGSLRTRGIDVAANYRTPVIFGNTRLQFSLVGTYLDKFVIEPVGGAASVGKYDCAGLFGDSCGTPNPEWRHRFRVSVPLNGNLSVSALWRYFSKVDLDYDQDNPLFGGGPGFSTDNALVGKIKAQNYIDLSLSAAFERYSMRLGVNNVFDRDPPITPNFSSNGSNTFANVYDSLGRYIFAGVTVDF
ncbi:MAG: TonB-dependent receptor [Sphingomicrobium sp.]